ncbi:IMP2'-like protein [Lachancea thermotolerans]
MEGGEPKRSILLPSKAETAGRDNIRILESEVPSRSERGRSREKKGSSANTAVQHRSRTSSRLRGDVGSYLKWTVLQHDPSERLLLGTKEGAETSDDDEDVSDEEQVSDVENEIDIDAALGYDLGARVLPNFTSSLWDVVQKQKPWVAKYNKSVEGKDSGVKLEELQGGYARAIKIVHGKPQQGAEAREGRSYIIYLDLTPESFYALLYVFGAVLASNDTLYVVHISQRVPNEQLRANVERLEAEAAYLLDASSAALNAVNVVLLSVSHPYPKHLLNELVIALKPMALCVPLSLVLSSLQNYVCPIPTVVIRRKLKRSKKKGFEE